MTESAATAKTAEIVRGNWERVQEQVAAAMEAASRNDEIQIVGVSKYVGPELTQQLVQAGCTVLGENRPQVLWAKDEWFRQNSDAQPAWHMIGHLQRNKARRTLPILSYLHSVDSLRLAKTLSEETAKIGSQLPILLEVNVTDDESKTGLPVAQLFELVEEVSDMEELRIEGLMAMSTHFSGGDQARREFAEVRKLRDKLQESFSHMEFTELSMGMSGDYREAIAEGATMVRIGSSLWEGIDR